MRKFKAQLLLIHLFGMLLLFSCEDDNINPSTNASNGLPDIGNDSENIPQWIYEEMSFFYYWDASLPENAPSDDEDPKSYFKSLLVSEDRYSYISDDAETLKEENNGTIMAVGFSTVYGVFTNSDNLFAIVEYVYPNSPADMAGLKRGDIILEIDGEALSEENYLDLSKNNAFSVTLGDFNGRGIVQTDDEISISTGLIDLDPVIFSEVIDVDNLKVGNLVFVEFISGEDDKWLNSLRDALSDMKSAGISELILDLRYNAGGEVEVAKYLASAIAPIEVVTNKEVLVSYEYNETLQEYFTDRQGQDSPNLKATLSPNENNLNLNKLYVLTSGSTASASELIISGLEPYMDVVVIGEPTFGKFYGSFLLYDQEDPPKHNWAIAPVVLKYINANGFTDFSNGLLPDFLVEDDLLAAKDFGDQSDPMLSTAISLIRGQDVSGARISSEKRLYEPIYNLEKISKKNVFFTNPVRMDFMK